MINKDKLILTEIFPSVQNMIFKSINIRMDLKEIDINTKIWVDLTQDRDYWRTLVNAALNLRVP